MKCKYCNSEIEGNVKFCPYCGKEIQQNVKDSDTKLSNGEQVDTLQPCPKRKFSTKWVWIILGIIIFCAGITFFHYSFSSEETYISSDNSESTQEISINSDENEIYKRVEEIYNTVYKGGKLEYAKIDNYDNKFCTTDFLNMKFSLSNRVADYAAIIDCVQEDADHWSLTRSDCEDRYDWKILDAQKTSEGKATAKVQINTCNNETYTRELDLLYEEKSQKGNWYIDDFKDGTYSEKEELVKQIHDIFDSVDEYFSNYGEKYNLDGVGCISYIQMKKIAQNELSVAQMNSFAKHLGYYYDKPSDECDYQTPKYKTPISAYFEVRLSRVSEKLYYNFWCRTKDKNAEYFDRLCKDLENDANEVREIGSGYRGFLEGVEYIDVVRDDTYVYVRILTNN